MRFAIVESGGKQYRAVEGRTIEVDRLPVDTGKKFDVERVLLMADGDDWKMGIVVDRQQNGYCTVFFPEPPDARQGEMKLIHESKLKKLDIPVTTLVRIMRRYGQGSASLVK